MLPVYTRISGLDLAIYEKTGTGTPVIFVHGNSSNAHIYEHIWNDRIFDNFHLIAFDLPGHGNSHFATDTSDYTIIRLSKLVAEIINQKQLKDAVLVAHSLGGHISLHAVRFTDHIKGIMLVGTAPCDNEASISAGYILSEDIMALFKNKVTDEELNKALEMEVYHKKHQAFIRNSYNNTDGRCRDVMATELGTFFSSENFVSEIDLLQKPGLQVALVLGEHERLINREYLENLPAINTWENRVHSVTESAHCPMLENPAEFAKLVRSFVTWVETSIGN